jgi:PAS domain S-box-containing protein
MQEIDKVIDNKHKELLELMSDAIVIVDHDGKVVFINKQTEMLFGYPREDILGGPVEVFIPDKIKKDHSKFRASYTQHPEARAMEVQKSLIGVTRQGVEVPVEIGLSPLASMQGNFTIATIRDVTKRRQIEQELRKAQEVLEKRVKERTADLQAANEKLQDEMSERKKVEEHARQQQAEITHVSRLSLLGEMSSGLAHELNQPLAAISNYSQGCIRRIQSGKGEQDSLIQAMERITSEANRASGIIARLRKFVRKEELQRTCINLNTILEEVLELVDFELRNHRVAVKKQLAIDLPEVCIDIIQIQQVLVNLIWNAIEAMDENAEDNRILTVCTALVDSDTVEIAVGDNGYGIGNEVMEKLFNQFFTTKEKGVGIGLSISRTIIIDHGGKIWAESSPDSASVSDRGVGTVFKLNLPIEKESHAK